MIEGVHLDEMLIRSLDAVTRTLNSTTLARRTGYEIKIQDKLKNYQINDLVLITHTRSFDPYQNVGYFVGKDVEDGLIVYMIQNLKNEIVRWTGVEILKILQEHII